MKSVLILLFLIAPAFAQARDLSVIYKNNRAVDLYTAEKRQEALEQFIGLTAKEPSDVQLAYNVATTLQTLGEEEKAIKLYARVLAQIDQMLKTADGKKAQELQTLRFHVLFNLGAAHQLLQQVPDALKNYQQALELVPESKEIKTNIEMLFAGGGGGGKGDKKEDKPDQQKGDGEGEGEPEEPKDEKEKTDQEKLKEQQEQQQQQQNKKPKEFNTKHMSNEDLKRIMEELKDQEQKIRAKMERKGSKSAPKDKEW